MEYRRMEMSYTCDDEDGVVIANDTPDNAVVLRGKACPAGSMSSRAKTNKKAGARRTRSRKNRLSSDEEDADIKGKEKACEETGHTGDERESEEDGEEDGTANEETSLDDLIPDCTEYVHEQEERSVKTIIAQWKQPNRLNIGPYQRSSFCWSEKYQSDLITTIAVYGFIAMPIVIHRREIRQKRHPSKKPTTRTVEYVVDGRHRLETVHRYSLNLFPWRIGKPEQALYYRDLTPALRQRFLSFKFRVLVLSDWPTSDVQTKFCLLNNSQALSNADAIHAAGSPALLCLEESGVLDPLYAEYQRACVVDGSLKDVRGPAWMLVAHLCAILVGIPLSYVSNGSKLRTRLAALPPLDDKTSAKLVSVFCDLTSILKDLANRLARLPPPAGASTPAPRMAGSEVCSICYHLDQMAINDRPYTVAEYSEFYWRRFLGLRAEASDRVSSSAAQQLSNDYYYTLCQRGPNSKSSLLQRHKRLCKSWSAHLRSAAHNRNLADQVDDDDSEADGEAEEICGVQNGDEGEKPTGGMLSARPLAEVFKERMRCEIELAKKKPRSKSARSMAAAAGGKRKRAGGTENGKRKDKKDNDSADPPAPRRRRTGGRRNARPVPRYIPDDDHDVSSEEVEE